MKIIFLLLIFNFKTFAQDLQGEMQFLEEKAKKIDIYIDRLDPEKTDIVSDEVSLTHSAIKKDSEQSDQETMLNELSQQEPKRIRRIRSR